MIAKIFEMVFFLIVVFFVLYFLSSRFRFYINSLFSSCLLRFLMKRMNNQANNFRQKQSDEGKANSSQSRTNNANNEKLDASDILKKKLKNKTSDQYVDFEEIKD